MASSSRRFVKGAYNLLDRLKEETYNFEDEVPFDERPQRLYHIPSNLSSRPSRAGNDPPGFTPEDDDEVTDATSLSVSSRSGKKRNSSRRRRSIAESVNQEDTRPLQNDSSDGASRGTDLDTSNSKPLVRISKSPTNPEEQQAASYDSINILHTKRKQSSSYRYATNEGGGIPTARSTGNVHTYETQDEHRVPLPLESSESASASGGHQKSGHESVSTLPVDESFGDEWSGPRTNNTNEHKIDFLKDDPRDMTLSRKLALWLMKRSAWYNPRLNSTRPYQADVVRDGGRFRSQDGYPRSHKVKETPSLQKAWAYFEHVTLTRYYTIEKEEKDQEKSRWTRIRHRFTKGNQQLDRAEPGESERPTKLYHPLFTPFGQLGDFGLGIGLYFATIRGLTILVLLAGVMHLPNVLYFAGEEYSEGQTDVDPLRRGSAICTSSLWVVCPTCTPGDFPSTNEGYSWLYSSEYNITLARKNLCEGATVQQGFVNFGCFLFICIGSIFLALYLKGMEKSFDEDEQTTRDYSVRIDNPPDDARDPSEWKEFFKEQFGAHVTGCTIALSNDRLVRTLKERREKMRKLEAQVEAGTSLDMVTLAGIAVDKDRERTFVSRMMGCIIPGFPETFGRVAVLTSIIQGLAQQEYPVTNVFLTFETETSQQEVLRTLTVSRYQVAKQKPTAVPHTRFLFRGNHLLSVREPEEPDSIKWEHLNASFAELFQQQIYTALATICALLVVVFIVQLVNDWNTIFTAYTIAITNVLFPFSAKSLTRFEAHPTAGSLQTSLYFKIALFRWVNTAIVITMITPFEDTLRNGPRGLITQIQAQFMAEITTVAFIQISDPLGHFQRHFLAPRSKTQDEMNINMQGTHVELAERYTSISKIMFLTLWYCSIYPASLFLCAFALQVIFLMDRFSLTRTWKRSPRLGSRISRFNRAYFLPLSIVAMAVFSSYFWSGFPYDNLCENEGSQVSDLYVGNYSIGVHEKGSDFGNIFGLYGGENVTEEKVVSYVSATIEANASTYRFCNQDFLGRGRGVSGAYPFVPLFQPEGDEWMTEEQEIVCTYYGWLSFFFAGAWLVLIIFRGLRNMVFSYFTASWKPTGEDQHMPYSDLDTVNLYIPEVKSPVISYPLLAVSVDNIDIELMEWHDPEHPHAYYDLTKDAEALVKHRGRCIHNKVFSTVYHFPPDAEEDFSDDEDEKGSNQLMRIQQENRR